MTGVFWTIYYIKLISQTNGESWNVKKKKLTWYDFESIKKEG